MKTKHNKNHIKFAILAISSVLMTSMIASAILADISMSYPSADPSLIQMIMTLPSLMGMIFAISAGPLSGKIAKKIIVLVGLFSAFTGGMLSYLFGSLSIYVLLLSSALIGVGQGINSTMSMALIADYFVGDESSSLMGLQSAFVNGGSMVIIFISSLLARLGWRSSYLIFLIFIPIIVIVMKYLPNDPPIQQQESSGEKGKLNGTVYFTAVVTFVFATLMFSFATNVAMFVVNNGLGDATTAGLANTLMSAGGTVAGVIYGSIKKRLKDTIIPTAILLAGVGLLLINIIGSIASVFIAGALIGFGLSLLMPTAMFIASSAVTPEMSANAISLINGASNIGMFVSPFILNPIVNNFGGGESFKFLLCGTALIILSIVAFVGRSKFNTSVDAK